MKVINLFGEPSAGKSTTAAGLFFLMKHAGYNVELVSEFAKDLIYEQRNQTLRDQLYILGKQNHKLDRLRGQVEYAISDSPLFLGIVYNRDFRIKSLDKFIVAVFNIYDNLNFFIERSKPYCTVGRSQTEREAAFISGEILDRLIYYGIPFEKIRGNKSAPDIILNKYLCPVK